MTQKQYQKCIDACIECATICNHCAISCLEEKDVQYLTKCIRLDLECAVICRAAAELMSLDSRYSKEVCQLCTTICNACAQICEQHANMGMEHCRECAEACRACAKETMEAYQEFAKAETNINKLSVHQNECAVISRAAAELMSLKSDWCKQICKLSTTICDAYASELDSVAKKEVKYARQCSAIANEAHQQLKDESKGVSQKSTDKKKKKHSSALLAASMWRSPVSAVTSNSYFGSGGDSSTIWTEYREEGGIG